MNEIGLDYNNQQKNWGVDTKKELFGNKKGYKQNSRLKYRILNQQNNREQT